MNKRFFGPRQFCLVIFTPLALTALGGGGARAADNMDKAITAHAPQIIRYLQEHRIRNAGVLKFRVQKGKQPISFRVGPLNANLASRLEAALVLADKVQSPVGIIHDADSVAMAKKLPSYTTPAGRRALFEQSYSLAWQAPAVKADVFLTGVVTVPPGLKSATVSIEALRPGSAAAEKVVSFQVATDRALLTDLNESFQISSRQLRRRTRGVEYEEDAVTDANALNDGTKKISQEASSSVHNASTSAVTAAPSTGEALIAYEIRYDNVAQSVTPDPNSQGELQVAEPTDKQSVSIYIKSLAKERLGMVLMVNGVSTLYEQKDEPAKCAAWVLEPGKPYVIKGYQVDKKTFKPFRVLSKADSEAVSYSDSLGLVHFYLFREGGSASLADDNKPTSGTSTDQPTNISLRGLSRSLSKSGGRARSLAALQEAYVGHSKSRRRTRGIIDADASAIDGEIQNDEVKNPVHVQTIVIRYRKASGS
jgi:hypothetical protein